MKMTFGKFKGTPISEVPDGYLVWLLDNLENLSPTLRSAIRIRLGLEEPAKSSDGYQDPCEAFFARRDREKEELDGKVKAWFRQLALDYHPDRRGSLDAMVALNDAHDRLRKALSL